MDALQNLIDDCALVDPNGPLVRTKADCEWIAKAWAETVAKDLLQENERLMAEINELKKQTTS